MIPANPIFDLLTDLATCLCAQIITDGSPSTCYCGVIPGEAPAVGYFGDCDESGVSYVRLVSAYPSKSVGQQDLSLNNCGSGTGLDVEVGILRLMTVGDEEGNMPSAAEILEATQQQIADMLTIQRAVRCCLDPDGYIFGAYTPIGPDGGVLGGSWDLNLQVM